MKTKPTILTKGGVMMLGGDSNLQNSVRAVLEAENYQVFAAASREEALEIFDTALIDILLIEVGRQPEGLESMLAQLKLLCPRLRTIGIRGTKNAPEKDYFNGVNTWIRTPLNPDQLAACMNELVADIRSETFRNETFLQQTTRFVSSAPYGRWGLNE